jgi:linoleoyl-CoA desaturase
MDTKQSTTIRFSRTGTDFSSTLNQRVNQYFKTKNISRNANTHMVVKTIFMYCLYWVPFIILLTNTVSGTLALLLISVTMGVGVAGIGLSVMHDANHGAYSNKSWINQLIGYSLNMVGGNALNWRIQHNVLHHTYTNIHDVDEDISPRGVLRMTPHGDWKPMHQFQFIYAWFLYGLMTLVWVFAKDFVRISKYHREGLIKGQKTNLGRELAILIATKVLYFGYILGLPMLLTDLTFGQWVVGFLLMHYVAGFILAVIFQPAHVIEGTSFPLPDDQGTMENSWAIHQLYTTTNFANNNRALSWFVGGLNYQIEHHLFPNVCHVHYRALSKIVSETAREFNLPYHSIPSFTGALWGHAKLLKELGKRPAVQLA